MDLTHQLDTGTQAGGVNHKTDDKPHWMNTSMTTNTDQGKKTNHKKITQTAYISSMNGNINDTKQLWIRQKNINKSLTAAFDLLNNTPPDKFDITVIQEPYLDHLRNTRENSKWYSVYPKTHYSNKSKCTGLMILVNKN